MQVVTYTIPMACPGKVRQSQRDKYPRLGVRPCVALYRAFKDVARLSCRNIPDPEKVERLTVIAHYATKNKHLIGKKKRTKPDGDNVLGSVMDALWKQDQRLGDCDVARRWGTQDVTAIIIEYED